MGQIPTGLTFYCAICLEGEQVSLPEHPEPQKYFLEQDSLFLRGTWNQGLRREPYQMPLVSRE